MRIKPEDRSKQLQNYYNKHKVSRVQTVPCKRCGKELKHANSRWCLDCKKIVDNEQRRERYVKNPEGFMKKMKKWQNKNKDKVYQHIRKWQIKNKGKVNEYMNNEQHKRRAQKRNSENTLTVKEWRDIQTSYSNKCVYCGAGGKLTQEHVIPLSKGGTHTADNVVPACLDCNRKKNQKSLLFFLHQRLGF